MPLIIKHTDRFKRGYFIYNSGKQNFSAFKENDSFFLTQQDNFAIKNEILKLIRECRNVLKICSFILTDREIFELILEIAKLNKVAIFILTHLDDSKLKNTSSIEDLMEDEPESAQEQHMRIIKQLYDLGVHVRAANETHAKFIISDRQNAFITSANLTTASLNLNTESGIYLNQKDALDLDRLFDIIFQKGTQYIHFVTATKRKNFIVKSDTNLSKRDIELVNKDSGLRYTYKSFENGLYRQILDIIDASREYLYLSSFCIISLNNLPEFKEAIEEAIRRNVEILIFCRGMNYREDHLEACEWLVQVGCKLYGDIYNHSKGIANEQLGLIFTANIDGRFGLKSGFEVGCVLNEKQRSLFVEFHKSVISHSDFEYLKSPVRKDFLNSYLYYQAKKGITSREFPKHISISSNCSDLLLNEDTFDAPIFFAEKGGKFYLIIGNNLFHSNNENGTFIILSKDKPDRSIEKYILDYETITIN